MDLAVTLNREIAAAQAGRKAEARRLLEAVLEVDQRNESAWLWLGTVVESEEERITCLENVLTINPNNEVARKGLATLRAGSASSPQTPNVSPSALRPPGPATPSPASDDSPPDRSHLADNRVFILITIVLALMLICTVVSILAFVILSPPG